MKNEKILCPYCEYMCVDMVVTLKLRNGDCEEIECSQCKNSFEIQAEMFFSTRKLEMFEISNAAMEEKARAICEQHRQELDALAITYPLYIIIDTAKGKYVIIDDVNPKKIVAAANAVGFDECQIRFASIEEGEDGHNFIDF